MPREILNRRKAGFPVPYETWLRKDLRGWLHDVLMDQKTLDRGYFEKEAIRGLLKDDQRSGGYSKELFSLAVLELWHRVFLQNGRQGNSELASTSAPEGAAVCAV